MPSALPRVGFASSARFGGKPPAKVTCSFETAATALRPAPHRHLRVEWVAPTWWRHAFIGLSDVPTGWFAFSDDMDGLRQGNLTTCRTMRCCAGHRVLPLTRIPDPSGCHDSFATTTTRCCAASSNGFGFDYEFQADRLVQDGRFRWAPGAACWSTNLHQSWRGFF